MFNKFISSVLLNVLAAVAMTEAAEAVILNSNNSFSSLPGVNIVQKQQKEPNDDDIVSRPSVFVYVNKSSRSAGAVNRSPGTSSANVCSSDNCKRRRSLSNSAPKVNVSAQAQKSLLQGDQFYKAGKFKDAVAAYQKAVKLKPNYKAYFGLGEANYELKQTKEALAAYQQAVKLNPMLDEAFYNIGVIRYEQKEFAAALEPLQQAVKIAPALADEYYYYGSTLIELKRSEEAAAALREAIKLNPKFTDASKQLAFVYYHINRKTEAVALLLQVVKQNPKDGYAFYELGNMYYNEKKYEDALASYKEAVRLLPDDANVNLWIGETYYSTSKVGEAAKAYQKALQLKPELKNDWGFAIRYGNSLRQINSTNEAIKWLNEAAKLDPQKDDSYWLLGTLYSGLNPPNYPLAIESLNQAAKLNSERKETFIMLVNAHINSSPRNPNEALQAARRLQQIAPNDATAHLLVGTALVVGQMSEPAYQVLKEAKRLDPQNGSILTQLCNVQSAMNKYKEGLKDCEEAVRFSTPEEKPLARTTLATMYGANKQYDKAIAEANAVIKEKPDFFFAYHSLGMTYTAMKKWDKAIEALKKAINLQPEIAEFHFLLAAVYWDAKKKSDYLVEYGILLNLNPKLAAQLKASTDAEAAKKKK